jgi:hypothetical protein
MSVTYSLDVWILDDVVGRTCRQSTEVPSTQDVFFPKNRLEDSLHKTDQHEIYSSQQVSPRLVLLS